LPQKLNPKNQYAAPGRVCLFGEHQDYLHLTVVPAAISLRTVLTIQRNPSKEINLTSQMLMKKETFLPERALLLANNEFDYFIAIVKVLYQNDLITKMPGFDVDIQSTIPIGAGLSSSAAVLVAWLTALNHELDLALTREEIAELCFQAEHDILGVNCGIMDQYASSLGGIFALDCNGPPYKITRFKLPFPGLIVGYSGVQRTANEPLTRLKVVLRSGLGKLAPEVRDYQSLEEYHLGNEALTKDERQKLAGVIKIRKITQKAIQELSKEKGYDYQYLGSLLTEQHRLLAENLVVSHPKLDFLVKTALDAGAFGAKLTGAGLGGCIIALAPRREEEVLRAISKAGGRVFRCSVDYKGATPLSIRVKEQ